MYPQIHNNEFATEDSSTLAHSVRREAVLYDRFQRVWRNWT